MPGKNTIKDASEIFEKGLSSSKEQFYDFSLYVAGMTSRSLRAVDNIKDLCIKHLEGRYELEVIDIYQLPERAVEDQIVAVPTLIKKSPHPVRWLIGDLSDQGRVLAGLNL